MRQRGSVWNFGLWAGFALECGEFLRPRAADECNALQENGIRLRMLEPSFTWRSSETHTVSRKAFTLTHANYLTSTACQGYTIRTGVTIDCARLEPTGQPGMQEDTWWFHLYAMFSRATKMEDMLLLRPPSKELLERGPPQNILAALRRFEAKRVTIETEATELARLFSFPLPP